MDGRQLNPRVRLAIAVAAAFAIAGLVGVAIAGGGENGRPTEGVALASAKTAVVAQQLASAVAAYAVQAQAIASVDDLAAHGVQLRRAEQALAVRGATTAQRLRERAVAAREAATSEEGVAALQAFGREAQIIGVRLQSLLAALTAAPSASVYERTVRRIGDELERGAPAPGGAVGADDPVPAG